MYTLIVPNLFSDSDNEMNEASNGKSASGVRNTEVWKKRKFQRDGVFGAVDH